MKLTWDYRVFRMKEGYVIGEVLCDEQGRIISCTRESVEPFGDSLEQLMRDIEGFKDALSKPVLTFDDIDQEAYAEWKKANDEANAQEQTMTHEQLMAELGLTDDPTPIGVKMPVSTP